MSSSKQQSSEKTSSKKVSSKKMSSKKMSSKKTPSKKEEYFVSGRDTIIVEHSGEFIEYNTLTDTSSSVSRPYYEYKKFIAGKSKIKPSHLTKLALLIAVTYGLSKILTVKRVKEPSVKVNVPLVNVKVP